MVANKKESLEWLTDQPEGLYEVKPWHPKRSVSANSYYWSMVNELAKAVGNSATVQHNLLLRDYSEFLEIDGEPVVVLIPDTPEAEAEVLNSSTLHLYPSDQVENGSRCYCILLGSSMMDSKQMARLIDGTVEDMKACGLVPPPTAEMAAALERMAKSEKQKNKGL